MHLTAYLMALVLSGILALGLNAGCSPMPAPVASATDMGRAQDTLTLYFSLLHDQRYDEAVAYYGGRYDVLSDWNPGVTNSAALFKYGCTAGGLQCLRIKSIVDVEQVSPTQFRFTVQFLNEDGTLFKRGPCCGASEAEMPTQTEFVYTVKKTGDKFLVQSLPVYVP